MAWSEIFQNPEFLEKTRIGMLLPEYRPLIQKWIGITDNCKILDVGCGTGIFGKYLACGMKGIEICGVDNDEGFVAYAKSNCVCDDNTFSFTLADAGELPFEDGYFDAVVSHTFLTSMPDYNKALDEMKRVCKPRKRIASLAGMSITNVPVDNGVYPFEWTWKRRYDELKNKMWQMFQAISPYQSFAMGVDCGRIPYLFSCAGLENVSVYPIGSFWSLSNAAVDNERKNRYIELEYISDLKRLDAVYMLEGADKYMSAEEVCEMKELMKKKKEVLKEKINCNNYWEWLGNGNLLVVGSRQ